MRLYRIYHPEVLDLTDFPASFTLNDEQFHHLVKVLRLGAGTQIQVVDGSGGHYDGLLEQVEKKRATARLTSYTLATNESPLKLHLVQGISRGDRMELTLQKCVELGCSEITPVFTQRGNVRFKAAELEKKYQRWHAIVVSACMQCYRDTIPKLNQPLEFSEYLASLEAANSANSADNSTANSTSDSSAVGLDHAKPLLVNLNPFAGQRLRDISGDVRNVHLLIGPEGGLSDDEIAQAQAAGYQDFNLGPRVLRTETTGLTAIAILQALLGDL